MKKHRGLFLALGLTALIGFVAGEARAASLTLTVYAGAGTTGTVLYTETPGPSQNATFNAAALTSAISSSYGAYTFSGVSGNSNNPGTSANGYVTLTGSVSVGAGSGADTPITLVLSETGFGSPASAKGNLLVDAGQANYSNTASDSTTMNMGTFKDSSSPPLTMSTSSFTLTSPAGPIYPPQENDATATLPNPYVTPYTLYSEVIISLSPGANATAAAPASLSFNNRVAVVSAAVPEPASIVMMLTGMPLPLVVLGLLRRRRRAAA